MSTALKSSTGKRKWKVLTDLDKVLKSSQSLKFNWNNAIINGISQLITHCLTYIWYDTIPLAKFICKQIAIWHNPDNLRFYFTPRKWYFTEINRVLVYITSILENRQKRLIERCVAYNVCWNQSTIFVEKILERKFSLEAISVWNYVDVVLADRLREKGMLQGLLGTYFLKPSYFCALRSKYDTCVENSSGSADRPCHARAYVTSKTRNLHNTLHEALCNEPCYFSEIVCWDITHLNLSIPGSALRTSSTIRIVTGREATAVKKPLECRFATQSLTSSILCWWSQDGALSTAFITVTLLSWESLRYIFRTWTWAVTWLFLSRDNLVISPVNATWPFPVNVGSEQNLENSSLAAKQTVLKRQKAARIRGKIPVIEILFSFILVF